MLPLLPHNNSHKLKYLPILYYLAIIIHFVAHTKRICVKFWLTIMLTFSVTRVGRMGKQYFKFSDLVYIPR